MDASGWAFKKGWLGNVDISAWLRSFGRPGKVFLFLEMEDEQGVKRVTIDHCSTYASDSVLLNGRVRMLGRGEIKTLELKVQYDGCDNVVMEELNLKAIAAKKISRPQPVV